ncbi:sulfatase-like hydrolase/transferase [Fenollaria sporofastidiosus]|uniref:sulfatase-like hydrolase/transferase n=1 Tax=Fenollaria sporofastidiosus TaxID=2811778 RepID=UPI001BFFF577|nr:sulfatase-like hydrolase/transferase [Fenollaria sporofastidiosus]
MKDKKLNIVFGIIFLINAIFYYNVYIYKVALELRPRLILLLAAVVLTSMIDISVLLAFKSKTYKVVVASLIGLLRVAASIFYAEFANFDILSRTGQAKELKGVGTEIMHKFNIFLLIICILTLVNIYLIISARIRKRDEKYKDTIFEIAFRCVISLIIAGILVVVPQSFAKGIFGTELFSSIALSNIKRELAEKEMHDEGIEDDIALQFSKREFKNNEFTGIAKDKNIIIIQCESLQNTFVGREYNGQEITPFMNKLIKEKGSIYFDNYFELLGMGNTSDAEFVSTNGIFPSLNGQSYKLFEDNEHYGLLKSSKDYGYTSMAFHGNVGKFYDREHFYKKMGIEKIYLGEDFKQDEIINMGLSDKSFFKQSIEKYKELAPKNEKFFSLMVTLTTHTPFILPDELSHIKPKAGDEDDFVYKYAKCARYTDEAIEDFFKDLDEIGLLKDCVIAIYGDHHAMSVKNPDQLNSITKWLGREIDYDEMMNIPLLIRVPGLDKNVQRHNIGSQLDLYATLLNLLGWDRTKYPNMGIDLLGDDEETENNVVFPQTHLLKGSFITKDKLFEYPRDRVFEHGRYINRKTREVLNVEDARELSKRAVITTDYSYSLMKSNSLMNLIKAPEKLASDKTILMGGGELEGLARSNVLDAFEYNYKRGKRKFEVDLSKTTDGKYVGLEDWDGIIRRFFVTKDTKMPEVKRLSYEEFKNLVPLRDRKAIDLDVLAGFMNEKQDTEVFICTKDDTKELLSYIKENYEGLMKRLTVEVHSKDEYKSANDFGFKNIVYSLENAKDIDLELKEIKDFKLTAIALDASKLDEETAKKLVASGHKVYAYKVNTNELAEKLFTLGITAIYTDKL